MENENGKNLFDVTRRSSVSVPTLLYHDTKENILVMTDLGTLPSMSDFFTDTVGGFNILSNLTVQLKKAGLFNLNIISATETELESFFTQLGTQFGHFLALIHSPGTLNVIRSRFGCDSKFPCDPSVAEAVVGWTVTRLRERLELFSSLLTEFDVTTEQLVDRAITNVCRETIEEERALIHGDAWPTAMLVVPALQKNNLPLSTGFIDWEYARIWRGVSSDFAVTSAHYALMEITAAFKSETMTYAAPTSTFLYLRKFRCAMITQYCVTSRQEGALWPLAFTNDDIPKLSDPRTLIFRSTMIAHGTEIIRLSVTRRWKCSHTHCNMESSELEDSKRNCDLLQSMIKYGLWYLCRAGASLSEFCGRDNWEKINKGHSEGFWLLDLFLSSVEKGLETEKNSEIRVNQ
jgi:hypothetical protein